MDLFLNHLSLSDPERNRKKKKINQIVLSQDFVGPRPKFLSLLLAGPRLLPCGPGWSRSDLYVHHRYVVNKEITMTGYLVRFASIHG